MYTQMHKVMQKRQFKVGDWVQSRYRARWTGVVLDVTKHKYQYGRGAHKDFYIVECCAIHTRSGVLQRRRIVSLLYEWQVRRMPAPTSLSPINPDWLKSLGRSTKNR